MPSQEHDAAVGEAPTAQEQLDVKKLELAQAQAGLEAAEQAYDVPRAVELQNRIAVLQKFIARLEATAAVEAATEARAEASVLQERLRKRYAKALDALAPLLERARAAIVAAVAAASECTDSWALATRLAYEIRVLEMRFALGETTLAQLPMAPVGALTEMFGDEIERSARQSVRQPLPVYSSSASDSPAQIAVNKMRASHAAVAQLASDLKLSKELRDLFEKAGAPPKITPTSEPAPAFIGTSQLNPQLQGAMHGALVGVNPPSVPETPAQAAEREETKRDNTRRQSAVAQELRAEAQRIAAEDELIRQGKLKGPLDQGMRG